MKVIVDTSIWSLALRRSKDTENKYVDELEELIKEVRAQLVGPVRQELLSGIKSEKQYKTLKKHLRAFKDLNIEPVDYELAAQYFNTARQKGIQGSNTDFLLCAISTRHRMPIFTADNDFINFQSVLPIELHKIRT
jgi:predicted nucleic acid-binding protein